MTAEEYALEVMQGCDLQEIESALIGFAKIKVKETLKIAAEKAKITTQQYGMDIFQAVDKESILNSVNLDEFIK